MNVHVQMAEDITEVVDEDVEDTLLDMQVINQHGTISLNTGAVLHNAVGDTSSINKGSLFVK